MGDTTQQQQRQTTALAHSRHDLRGRFRRLATKIFGHETSPVGSPAASPLSPRAAAAATTPVSPPPALAPCSTIADLPPTATSASSIAVAVAIAAEDDKQPAPELDTRDLKPRARTVSSSDIHIPDLTSESNASALPPTTIPAVVAIAPVSMAPSENQVVNSASSLAVDDEQFDEREYNYDEETACESGDENQDANAEQQQQQQMSRSDSNSSAGGAMKNAIAMTLGLATAEGLTGHANEDRIIVEQNEHFRLLAVLDGHGGGWTADFVKDKLFDIVARCYDNGFDPETLAAAIDSLDQEVQGKATQMQDYSGACMVCVLLFVDAATGEPQTLTLNVGDCRAIMHETRAKGKKANKGVGPNGRLYALSEDHCEANKKETARVLASGACIEYGRIGGVLEPFRSIGDIDMKEREMDGWVIATPEIKKTRLLLGRSTLVLATDGVWGSLANQRVMTLVRQFPTDLQAGADAIVTAAREAGSMDDIAVIVARV